MFHFLTLGVKVSRNGRIAKSWIQRIRMNGKPTHIGLGAWPVITLAMARDKATENARALALGRAPRDGTTQIPTFAKAAETVIGIHAKGWKDGGKSENQWRSSLRDYVLPKIGHNRVNDITAADVMGVLVPHRTGEHETMRRVKQRVSAVMRWSMAQGYRQDDPAGDALNVALPKRGKPHRQTAHLDHGAAPGNILTDHLGQCKGTQNDVFASLQQIQDNPLPVLVPRTVYGNSSGT